MYSHRQYFNISQCQFSNSANHSRHFSNRDFNTNPSNIHSLSNSICSSPPNSSSAAHSTQMLPPMQQQMQQPVQQQMQQPVQRQMQTVHLTPYTEPNNKPPIITRPLNCHNLSQSHGPTVSSPYMPVESLICALPHTSVDDSCSNLNTPATPVRDQ